LPAEFASHDVDFEGPEAEDPVGIGQLRHCVL
jgi:hypothetical protein